MKVQTNVKAGKYGTLPPDSPYNWPWPRRI
jgi:hypothetical protein